MRWFFRILPVALALVLVAGLLIARGLPKTSTLERDLVIEAPPAVVYEHLARIRRWSGWYVAPDAGRFEGPEIGAGGTLILVDPEAQEMRRLELVKTSSPSEVAYRFPEVEQLPFDVAGSFHLSEAGSGRTLVTSRQHLTARAPEDAWMSLASERWFLYLMADRFVGSILERELHNLKQAVERRL